MAISDWPLEERPREKLLRRGAASLSDAELLAVFLRTGRPGHSAVDVARQTLGQFRGLRRLFAASAQEVVALPGLGPARYAALQAALELCRRTLSESLCSGDVLKSPGAVRDYLRLTLQSRPVEVFMGVFLDAQNRVIAADELFQGTLTQTSVYPREVVKQALRHNCAAVIFAHNHPSGLAEPSAADQFLTQALQQALALVEIRVLDHFIIGGSGAMSFAERGLL